MFVHCLSDCWRKNLKNEWPLLSHHTICCDFDCINVKTNCSISISTDNTCVMASTKNMKGVSVSKKHYFEWKTFCLKFMHSKIERTTNKEFIMKKKIMRKPKFVHKETEMNMYIYISDDEDDNDDNDNIVFLSNLMWFNGESFFMMKRWTQNGQMIIFIDAKNCINPKKQKVNNESNNWKRVILEYIWNLCIAYIFLWVFWIWPLWVRGWFAYENTYFDPLNRAFAFRHLYICCFGKYFWMRY